MVGHDVVGWLGKERGKKSCLDASWSWETSFERLCGRCVLYEGCYKRRKEKGWSVERLLAVYDERSVGMFWCWLALSREGKEREGKIGLTPHKSADMSKYCMMRPTRFRRKREAKGDIYLYVKVCNLKDSLRYHTRIH